MTWRPVIALVAGIGAIVVAACGAATAPSGSPAAGVAAQASGPLAPGAQIPEPQGVGQPTPTPANEAARLLQKSVQILSFCAGWRAVTSVDEPPQYDVDKTVDFATSIVNDLNRIDPTAQIQDRHTLTKKEISLPAPVTTALQTEQSIYAAYSARVSLAQSYAQHRWASTTQIDSYLDHAFQLLLTSTKLTQADIILYGFYDSYC